jgi:hypothetical protein
MEEGLVQAGAYSLAEEGHLGDPWAAVLERHQVVVEAWQYSYRRESCCPVNVLSVAAY